MCRIALDRRTAAFPYYLTRAYLLVLRLEAQRGDLLAHEVDHLVSYLNAETELVGEFFGEGDCGEPGLHIKPPKPQPISRICTCLPLSPLCSSATTQG